MASTAFGVPLAAVFARAGPVDDSNPPCDGLIVMLTTSTELPGPQTLPVWPAARVFARVQADGGFVSTYSTTSGAHDLGGQADALRFAARERGCGNA
jgi:hypothetical protein